MYNYLLLTLLSFTLSASAASFEETLYPDWKQTFTKEKELLNQKTDHQELTIFENKQFGKVLTLDGIVQLTEKDEPIYSEMLAHVPLFSHDHPTSVLIIGGGDGGILREVAKHTSVQQIVLVDIDAAVIETSKTYFPKLSNGAFEDPRLNIVIQDAAEYLKSSEKSFDVIICDSTDPVGPGAVLFTSEFYGHCKQHLRPDGILAIQNGVPFLQTTELALTYKNRLPHFKHVTFYVAPIPTYVGGFMAFGWASDRDYSRISKKTLKNRSRELSNTFFYYTPEIHKASFALPNYMIKQFR